MAWVRTGIPWPVVRFIHLFLKQIDALLSKVALCSQHLWRGGHAPDMTVRSVLVKVGLHLPLHSNIRNCCTYQVNFQQSILFKYWQLCIEGGLEHGVLLTFKYAEIHLYVDMPGLVCSCFNWFCFVLWCSLLLFVRQGLLSVQRSPKRLGTSKPQGLTCFSLPLPQQC